MRADRRYNVGRVVLAEGAHIAGTVTAAGGGALENIEVTIARWRDDWGDWDQFTGGQTDAEGHYDVGGLAAGSYRVRFWDGSGAYAGEWFENAPDAWSGQDVAVTAGGTTHVDAALEQACVIEGHVTDGSANPLSGIEAILYYREAGAASGRSTSSTTRNACSPTATATSASPVCRARTYQLRLEDTGEPGTWAAEVFDGALVVGAGTDLDLAPGETRTVDPVLDLGGNLAGRLLDDESFIPLSFAFPMEIGVWTWLPDAGPDGGSWQRYAGYATGDGHRRLHARVESRARRVPRRLLVLDGLLRAGGLARPARHRARDPGDDRRRPDDEPRQCPDAALGHDLRPRDRRRWRPAAERPREGVDGERVGLGPGLRVLDLGGRLLPAGQPAGRHVPRRGDGREVGLSRKFWDGATSQFSATPLVLAPREEVYDIDIQLEAAGTAIGGTVRNAGGDPIAGAPVELAIWDEVADRYVRLDDGYSQTTTDGDGAWRIDWPSPGTYRVTAGPAGPQYGEASVEDVEVVSEETTQVDLVLPVGASISGTVTDTSGQPVAGCRRHCGHRVGRGRLVLGVHRPRDRRGRSVHAGSSFAGDLRGDLRHTLLGLRLRRGVLGQPVHPRGCR